MKINLFIFACSFLTRLFALIFQMICFLYIFTNALIYKLLCTNGCLINSSSDNKKNLTQGLKVGTTKIGKKIDKTEMLIKVNSRRSTILKPFVGKEVWIYNGQSYIKRKITETMVGHKFGEFAYTRKRYVYKKKNTAVRGGRKG